MGLSLIAVKTDAQIIRLVTMAEKIWTEWYSRFQSADEVKQVIKHMQSRAAILNDIENNIEYYFVCDGEETLGYLAFKAEINYLYMSKLYLYEHCRKKGYGLKMFELIKNEAQNRNLDFIRLFVNADNPTVNFYKKIGFDIKETKPKDMGGGVVMTDYIMEYASRR